MGSQGGGVQEPKVQNQPLEPLARQGSLYNLTLDEVQNQLGNLGKPLGSMNLDELLKSVWTVEVGQCSGLDSGDNSTNLQPFQVCSSVSSLHRQGSLTLSGELGKKTVDEVWKDMQPKKKNTNQDRKSAHERQPTLGEMTLEDFLVKAGVANESIPANSSAMVGVDSGVATLQSTSQHAQWMQYQPPSVQQPQQQLQHGNQQSMMLEFMAGHPAQQPFPVGVNPVLDAAYSETRMAVSPSSLMGTLSDTQSPGRKRVASDGAVEKTVERRQKRMIKNRESAARSRARKQAYTHELEIKVSRLEEENARLRRQNEIERVLPSAPPPEPKHPLRRTSSASF